MIACVVALLGATTLPAFAEARALEYVPVILNINGEYVTMGKVKNGEALTYSNCVSYSGFNTDFTLGTYGSSTSELWVYYKGVRLVGCPDESGVTKYTDLTTYDMYSAIQIDGTFYINAGDSGLYIDGWEDQESPISESFYADCTYELDCYCWQEYVPQFSVYGGAYTLLTQEGGTLELEFTPLSSFSYWSISLYVEEDTSSYPSSIQSTSYDGGWHLYSYPENWGDSDSTDWANGVIVFYKDLLVQDFATSTGMYSIDLESSVGPWVYTSSNQGITIRISYTANSSVTETPISATTFSGSYRTSWTTSGIISWTNNDWRTVYSADLASLDMSFSSSYNITGDALKNVGCQLSTSLTFPVRDVEGTLTVRVYKAVAMTSSYQTLLSEWPSDEFDGAFVGVENDFTSTLIYRITDNIGSNDYTVADPDIFSTMVTTIFELEAIRYCLVLVLGLSALALLLDRR